MDFKKEEREIATAEKQWLAKKDQLERERRSASITRPHSTADLERFSRRGAALGSELRALNDRVTNWHVQEREAIDAGLRVGTSPIRSFGRTYTNAEAEARIVNLQERATRGGAGSDRLLQEARELTAGLQFNSPAAAERTVRRAAEIVRSHEARVQSHIPTAAEQMRDAFLSGIGYLLQCRCRCHRGEECRSAARGVGCCPH